MDIEARDSKGKIITIKVVEAGQAGIPVFSKKKLMELMDAGEDWIKEYFTGNVAIRKYYVGKKIYFDQADVVRYVTANPVRI